MRTDFYKRFIKLIAQKNIQIMKACCIIVVGKLRVVLQKCLKTISSVLSMMITNTDIDQLNY